MRTAPNSPAISAPISGRKTMSLDHRASALHHVDVFDRDRAAVAEEDDEDGEADRRLGGGDGQHEQREDLADESPRNAEKATRLMLTASRISSTDIRMTMTFLRLRKMPNTPSVNRIAATVRIVAETDLMPSDPFPAPALTLTTSIAVFGVRATCAAMFCRLTPGRCAQRQHDGADHRDQQHEARDLEEVDVVRIEHVGRAPRCW
jgi:hypothetical protein